MDLVILAAGEGKRFGGDKLLADIDVIPTEALWRCGFSKSIR